MTYDYIENEGPNFYLWVLYVNLSIQRNKIILNFEVIYKNVYGV